MADIVRTEDVLGGEPRIGDTRVGVLDIYELVIEGDYPPADVADQLDRSLEEVYAALAYYYEHVEEMRTLRKQRAETETKLANDALRPPEPAQ